MPGSRMAGRRSRIRRGCGRVGRCTWPICAIRTATSCARCTVCRRSDAHGVRKGPPGWAALFVWAVTVTEIGHPAVACQLLSQWLRRVQAAGETLMLRYALLVAMTLCSALAFAQAPQLVDAGKLSWGTSATFPPFEYMQNTTPVGFDVDMVAAIARQMKLESSVAQIAFTGLIPAIEGKRIDLIVSGMYINPQRTQVIDMIPYVYVGNQVVVLTGNPKHITGKDGLCGLNVAAPVGTVFETSAKEASAACKSAGKPEIDLDRP